MEKSNNAIFIGTCQKAFHIFIKAVVLEEVKRIFPVQFKFQLKILFRSNLLLPMLEHAKMIQKKDHGKSWDQKSQ